MKWNTLITIIVIALFPCTIFAQSNNYWTRNFNEESSLLSGAVVGGGAGPSAIYYNPSNISEIYESKFSLHASLFSFHFFKIKNGLGNGIDLSKTTAVVEPRFLSYMLQPKKYPKWSFEFAFLNNENYHLEFTTAVDQNMDIIQSLPGEERYFAMFEYLNNYRDDWVGAGASWKINPNLFIGTSMFVAIRSLEYRVSLDINAYPLDDSIYVNDQLIPFYSAGYQEAEYLKFTNYRVLWKVGMMYKMDNLSFGVSLTTPSVNVYSTPREVYRKVEQSNIKAPETDEFLPNYVVPDYEENKRVDVNFKSPLSIAAGLTYYFPKRENILYTTVEFFEAIDPYKIVQAEENPYLESGSIYNQIPFDEWLTYVHGAKPVFNAAVGYSWNIKENLILMTGFRTDFNYRKDIDYAPLSKQLQIKNLDLDIYHFTGGLVFTVRGQELITGLQYNIGGATNQEQFANLVDPVEWNPTINAALQGTPENNMNTFSNSVSIYFGATFHFGDDKDK